MIDPIPPALARRPAEAAELVCLAISDGDLEAALAQYERGAVLHPWEMSADGFMTVGTVAGELTALMEIRLPLALQISAIVPGSGVALVLGERRMCGTGPDGEPVQLAGSGATVVRRGTDGIWRIAADAWRLALDGGTDWQVPRRAAAVRYAPGDSPWPPGGFPRGHRESG